MAGALEHAWHFYLIRFDLEQLRIGRDDTIVFLKKQGIGASEHFIHLRLHPHYRDNQGYFPKDFTVASAIFVNALYLFSFI